MGKQNLNRIITMCLIAIMVVVTFPISVKADVGQKAESGYTNKRCG